MMHAPEFLPSTPPTTNHTSPLTTPWIALVERGSCAFVDKVRWMQRSGAAGVIVGDDQANSGLITMFAQGDTHDVHIPATFVAQQEYKAMRTLAMRTVRFALHRIQVERHEVFREDENADHEQRHETSDTRTMDHPYKLVRVALYPSGDAKWPLIDILLIAVLVPLLLLIFLFILWRFRRRHQRWLRAIHDAQAEAARALRPTVLSQTRVDAQLPTRLFCKGAMAERDTETCTVCLDDFEDGDHVRRLARCGHDFHGNPTTRVFS
jgi:E3 ubiquitin-protein ligase RNF13